MIGFVPANVRPLCYQTDVESCSQPPSRLLLAPEDVAGDDDEVENEAENEKIMSLSADRLYLPAQLPPVVDEEELPAAVLESFPATLRRSVKRQRGPGEASDMYRVAFDQPEQIECMQTASCLYAANNASLSWSGWNAWRR